MKKEFHLIKTKDDEYILQKVFITKDYESFKFEKNTNRLAERGKKKYKDLRDTIIKNGYMVHKPVECWIGNDGFKYISDGQHRFLACEELGLNVYYIIIPENKGHLNMRVSNSAQSPWLSEDILHHWCGLGNSEYIKLKMFLDRWKLKPDRGHNLIFGKKPTVGIFDRQGFLNGEFKATDQQYEQGNKIAKRICKLRDKCNSYKTANQKVREFINGPKFLAGAFALVINENYNEQRMMEAIEINSNKIVYCNGWEDCQSMLLDIYNHRLSKNKITLL